MRSRPTATIRSFAGSTAPAGSLGTGQSLTYWLGWIPHSVQEADIPWSGVTQVSMFALKTTDGTALDTTTNGLNNYNMPGWVSLIHQHGKLAIVSIGGSNDTNWVNACNSTNISGFTANLVDYVVSNGFDGVDLDIESDPSNWASCVQTISTAMHAATTQAGNTPIVETDIDESDMDSAVADFYQYIDQFNLMYYGYPTGSWNCGAVTGNGSAGGPPAGAYGTCSYVNQLVVKLHDVGHVPYNKMLLGFSPGGGQAQCCYANLARTAGTVDTEGPATSIPLSSGLSAAIPAGEIVLASGESPPLHYQMFTTPGAAAGGTSIPITGVVAGITSGAYGFPGGSEVQNAYEGPWDCGNFARYATAHGLRGVMIWDLQEEASIHNGQFPCFGQVAPYTAQSS